MRHDALNALSLPLEERAQALLALREDQWFERKSARIHPRDLADTLVGLANAEGGLVVIGIHGGIVESIGGIGRRENDWRQAPANFTVPPVPARFETIDCRDVAGEVKRLFVVLVEPSDRVHANQRDEVFLRIGDETRRLSFAQRRELEFDKGQSTFEATPARGAGRDDLDDDLLAELVRRLGHPDPDRLLSARGLVDRAARVSVGAVLLFGRRPQLEFPEAYVRVVRYHGTERGTGRRQQIIEDIRVEGTLPVQIIQAQEVIARFVPIRRALGPDGRFTDVGVVPRDAWLEGLVNAVTHRSYSIMGDHIRVAIFDDRIEIDSPGRFPGIVDIDEPEEVTRFARNPRVARILADLGFGQELGEGIRRMFEEMRLAGLAQPEYRQTSGSVRLTLRAEPIDRVIEDRLPPTSRQVIRAIRERGRASTGDLVELTGRSRPVVLRDLRALEKEGIVEWVGTSKQDPRAYWQLRAD